MAKATGGIGFIGAGNMAEALIGGMIKAGIVDKPVEIAASDVRTDRLAQLKNDYKITTCEDNKKVFSLCKVVVFAVKPQNMADVLEELAGCVEEHHLSITLCAGISTKFLEKRLGNKTRVIRVMPNTPALIGLGISALCQGANATDEDLEISEAIFHSVGETVRLDEEHLNAVTALSGSGPAYFFHLIECLIEAGKRVGIPADASEKLVKQTALGAAKMCVDSAKTPGELREMVTSPKGTTWAALEIMKRRDFPDVINEAISAATNRAAELGGDD